MVTKKVEIDFHDGREDVSYSGVSRVDDTNREYKIYNQKGELLACIEKTNVKNLVTRDE
jgi:hypothetical protein